MTDFITSPDGLPPSAIRELQAALNKLVHQFGLTKILILPPGTKAE
jgi:hypothetical protein